MNSGRTVFSQLVQHLPEKEFQKCVARHHGDSNFRGFSCWDQYLAMAFAQFNSFATLFRTVPEQKSLLQVGKAGKVA
jgi:Domain of unknown function (DUF4372)